MAHNTYGQSEGTFWHSDQPESAGDSEAAQKKPSDSASGLSTGGAVGVALCIMAVVLATAVGVYCYRDPGAWKAVKKRCCLAKKSKRDSRHHRQSPGKMDKVRTFIHFLD